MDLFNSDCVLSDMISACALEAPNVENSFSDFDRFLNYSNEINVTVNVTCKAGYEWSLGETQQEVTCADYGWNMTEILHCQKGE